MTFTENTTGLTASGTVCYHLGERDFYPADPSVGQFNDSWQCLDCEVALDFRSDRKAGEAAEDRAYEADEFISADDMDFDRERFDSAEQENLTADLISLLAPVGWEDLEPPF